MSTEPARLPHGGMVALRADLGAEATAEAVRAATGCAMPGRLRLTEHDGRRAVWMAPDELLLMGPEADTPRMLQALGAGLAGRHHLAQDVGAMRVGFGLAGAGARDALAKLTPADMSADAFPAGAARRTRAGQVAALILSRAGGRFELYVMRSAADYAAGLLARAADAHGAVGFHAPVQA